MEAEDEGDPEFKRKNAAYGVVVEKAAPLVIPPP